MKKYILSLLALFVMTTPFVMAASSSGPNKQENTACTWEDNNASSFCLTMQNHDNFPDDLLVLVTQAPKGELPSKVEEFSIEVRSQEHGGDDDFVNLYTIPGAGDFKGIRIGDLPCGLVLIRAVIGATPTMPEGTNTTGAVPYHNVCSSSSSH